MRQPARPDDADTPLRLCYTGPAPARERQEEMEAPVRPAHRGGLRDVGEPVRADLAARHPALRHARQPAPASGARRGQRGPGDRRRRRGPARGETGELLLRNPVITPGYWGMPERDRRGDHRRRLAAHRRPGHRWAGRHVHVRGPEEGGAPPPRGEPVPARGRGGRSPSHPSVLECAVVGVPSELSEEEVKAFVVPAAGRRSWTSPSCARTRRRRLAAFKVPRYWQAVNELPRTPTSRVAKHRLPRATRRASTTPRRLPDPARERSLTTG